MSRLTERDDRITMRHTVDLRVRVRLQSAHAVVPTKEVGSLKLIRTKLLAGDFNCSPAAVVC